MRGALDEFVTEVFAPLARQYSGTLGKVGNAQTGVSVHSVTDTGSCLLDWRLFLPRSWDDTYCDTAQEAE